MTKTKTNISLSFFLPFLPNNRCLTQQEIKEACKVWRRQQQFCRNPISLSYYVYLEMKLQWKRVKSDLRNCHLSHVLSSRKHRSYFSFLHTGVQLPLTWLSLYHLWHLLIFCHKVLLGRYGPYVLHLFIIHTKVFLGRYGPYIWHLLIFNTKGYY